MEPLKNTLGGVMKTLRARRKSALRDNPETIIKKIFSTKERRHVQFNYLKKGVLGLKVDSSVWLYHLNLKKEGLLIELGRNPWAIKEIRFRLGEMK